MRDDTVIVSTGEVDITYANSARKNTAAIAILVKGD